MPILTPFLAPAIADLASRFGIWALGPLALIAMGAWSIVAWIRSLQAQIAAKDATILSLQEARLTDAKTQLSEMLRVARETEQARAQRRELDERFLPIQQTMIDIAQRLPLPLPRPPETR